MPHRLRVADIMTREVLTLAEDDTLADARRFMERAAIRHLPVLRDGVVVGVLSHRDLLAASFSLFADVTAQDERRMLAAIPAREAMHEALVIPPETPVPAAARLMLDRKLGCLPVTDGERRLLGIITEADFVRLAARLLELM